MKKLCCLLLLSLAFGLPQVVFARPGGGGGGRAGSGGGPIGGGGPVGGAGAGGARSGAPTFNARPSASPSLTSAGQRIGNPGSLVQPAGNLKPGNLKFNEGKLGELNAGELQPGQRVTSDKLDSFLNNKPAAGTGRAQAAQAKDNVSQPGSQWQTQRQAWTQSVQGNVRSQVKSVSPNLFTPAWYTDHPNAWKVAHPHADAYAAATWTAAASWLAVGAAPVAYGYPTTVIYEDDDAETTTTPDAQYAVTPDPVEATHAAAALAQTGRTTKPGKGAEWLPLGVFALVPGEQESSNQLIQLQVSKEGLVNGSYIDLISQNSTVVQGAVNKDSQRVAWTIGTNNNLVFETGLENLTQDSAPLVVRYGQANKQQWTLVRVPDPGK